MHPRWRKFEQTCVSLADRAAVAVSVSVSITLLFPNSDVYVPAPPNSIFLLASPATPFAASTHYLGEYTCTH